LGAPDNPVLVFYGAVAVSGRAVDECSIEIYGNVDEQFLFAMFGTAGAGRRHDDSAGEP